MNTLIGKVANYKKGSVVIVSDPLVIDSHVSVVVMDAKGFLHEADIPKIQIILPKESKS